MTASERVELEAAYVLHSRAYRDTSALLELFTADYGRVGLVARGVRRRRSRQAGLLQPFRPLQVSWRARGELGTLTGVEAAAPPPVLNGQRLVAGFYANEILLRLLARHQPHALAFSRYAGLLEQLAAGKPLEPSLRLFERDLLTDLGYGLSLTMDTAGRPVRAGRLYRYELEHGPVLVEASATHRRIAGESLLALARGEPSLDDEPALKRLMRSALGLYLGNKPLKSRELYSFHRGETVREGEHGNDD